MSFSYSRGSNVNFHIESFLSVHRALVPRSLAICKYQGCSSPFVKGIGRWVTAPTRIGRWVTAPTRRVHFRGYEG